jgi:hypothetical protein
MHDIEAHEQQRNAGRPCSVCNHPELDAIHLALADGSTYRAISDGFAPLSRNAVRRHALAHLPVAIATEVERAQQLTPSTLLGRVHDVARSAREAREEAMNAGHHGVAVRAGDAELRALSILASLGIRDESEVDGKQATELDLRILGTLIRAFPELAQEAERQYVAHGYASAAERVRSLVSRNKEIQS